MSHPTDCSCALCRVTVRTSTPAPLKLPLTELQLAALALAAEGQSDKAIARSLQVSAYTARSHLQAAFRKLDVHDRTHAVAKCFRLGLIA